MVTSNMPSPPRLASASSTEVLQKMEAEVSPKTDGWSLRKLGSLLAQRHCHDEIDALSQTLFASQDQSQNKSLDRRLSVPEARPRLSAIPSLPRPQTFCRQESERRERLLEVPPGPKARQESSVAFWRRTRGSSASAAARPSSPKSIFLPTASALELEQSEKAVEHCQLQQRADEAAPQRRRALPALAPLKIPSPEANDSIDIAEEDYEVGAYQVSLQEEHDQRWILNLSMHFRDKSNREKFFVTYAKSRSQWRRLTISLDYRSAPEGSLEADLNTLHYQRDKSLRIYDAIRDSLSEIQYYDTVTNLKLATTPEDGQLHVHVREDANEVIQYPSTSLFGHVDCPLYRESELDFHSHVSGFVYKVMIGEEMFIKKEIPGPDTVDEFLYEVNALYALLDCDNVVQLRGLVTDPAGSAVKALLISYAPQGALVDMIYDFRRTLNLPWFRREKWAKQIVQGLADIHEAGFVQGDFTLSNIVIDEQDNVQIIDINRRGCPVGWESPELSKLISSGQRIGMCIGVKTDLFQLGMVLWALAEEEDEPEREDRPLRRLNDETPGYYRNIVDICLSERPQGRINAQRLLDCFPASAGWPPLWNKHADEFPAKCRYSGSSMDNSMSTTHRSDKEYIDPRMAITLEEVRARREAPDQADLPSGVTYLEPNSNAASTTNHFDSSGSWLDGQTRGRSPVSSMQRRSSPYARSVSSTTSLSDSPTRYPNVNTSKVDAFVEHPSRNISDLVAGNRLYAGDCCSAISAMKATSRRSNTQLPPSLMMQQSSFLPDHFSPRVLQHVDSGFDEHMIQELDAAATSQSDPTTSSSQDQNSYILSTEKQVPDSISPTASVTAMSRSMTKTYVTTDHDDFDSGDP